MNIEILGQSLGIAVDQAFVIEADERRELVTGLQELDTNQAQEELRQINSSQSAGLRLRVAEAYGSGNIYHIRKAQTEARVQAIKCIGRGTLRRVLQSPQKNRYNDLKDSTIRRMNKGRTL
jgi:hypothetical protein